VLGKVDALCCLLLPNGNFILLAGTGSEQAAVFFPAAFTLFSWTGITSPHRR
jgi:hypothetical protein